MKKRRTPYEPSPYKAVGLIAGQFVEPRREVVADPIITQADTRRGRRPSASYRKPWSLRGPGR